MKKKALALSLTGILALGAVAPASLTAYAVGEGPNYGGNESIQTSILYTYDEMVDYLKKQDAKQDAMQLEVIGQTVKNEIFTWQNILQIQTTRQSYF